ncbi:T9SS type A sorting domain-containing protein [Spirosoma taeanense]|uniref:T9SS type A sorting domain-containing protein n=1 Tax=Spirosoma taeanense TaxID=2735870 RepID=A0A6M5Y3X5_9BACT|nr:metallophosphoesterase [Spirosoma taeanense]QJW88465.1 T9SS type A sorting domain-containing protein [Spirosoma taeanense]
MKQLSGLFACLSILIPFFTAAQTPRIVRGPYLQVITPTSVIIRWRTDQLTVGRLWYGASTKQLTNTLSEKQPALDHSLTLTGLQAATRYAYAVGYDNTQLGSGADYYVQTAPASGAASPFRMWVLGDFGYGNSDNQLNVYRAIRNATADRPADLWLWLGDNAYCCGKEDQFQTSVFDTYAPTFRNTPSLATPGNHDYADNNRVFDIAYYNLFSFPQQGEAGGVASGSKAYYSADYGNVHLVSLDSYGLEAGQFRLYDTTGTQVQWLKRDLAANKLPWTVVFFHHPPYSKGSHDSDTEEQMRLLRQNLTPILERYGVDLVLSGHSHVYERFYRMKGHTGLANTFDPAKHTAELTTARYDGSPNSCPILSKGAGTVYVVNGSGGALGGKAADYPHPATIYGNTTVGGSMLIDVNDNRLDAQLILADGSVPDRFTILKNVNKTTTLTAEYADTIQLKASWPGEYRWPDGQSSRTIPYAASKAGTFPLTVQDKRQCLTDQFMVTVLPEPKVTASVPGPVCAGSLIDVRATVNNTARSAEWSYDVLLSDATGNFDHERLIGSGSLQTLRATLPAALPKGDGYRLRVRPRNRPYVQSIASNSFVVKTLPTATLSGSTTVLQGQPVSLTLSFTSDGPWQGSLSTGTMFNTSVNPFTISVLPAQSTVYSLSGIRNECGQGTASGDATVTVVLPTETEEFAGGQLRIYPNPAQDIVHIDLTGFQSGKAELTLRDEQGRLMFKKQITASSFTHEVVPMPVSAGYYLLTVQIGKYSLTRKVIRQ